MTSPNNIGRSTEATADEDIEVIKCGEESEEVSTSDEEVCSDEEEYGEELTSEEIMSLLNLAVENDRVDIVKEMLQQYPDYLNGNDNKTTPLHICMQNKSIQCLNCLLRMGADPSIMDINKQTAYNFIKGDATMINQAFFMELVRVMNIPDVNRIEQLLNSGYSPDSSILDWIPDGLDKHLEDSIQHLLNKFQVIQPSHSQPDQERVIEEPPPPPQAPPQAVIVTNKVSKLKQEMEEKTQLEKQLQRNLEDMVQIVTISQSLILSGSSALVAHVRKLKANKVQKEIELEQYESILHDLKLKFQINPNTAEISNSSEQNLEENEELIIKLTQELNDKQTKINRIKSNILDLSEENTRIAAQIHHLGLSGALTFTKTLYDDVRSLDLLISNAQAEEVVLRDKLGLDIQNINVIDNDENKSVDHNVDIDEAAQDSNSEEDDDNEYEEDSEEEQSDDNEPNNTSSYTINILSGKSKAIIVRPNSSLDIWDIIRRIIGRVVIVSTSGRTRKKKNSSVMII